MADTSLSRLAWLDMEMTGLDPGSCVPVEVALIVTDSDLHELDSYETVIHQDEGALATMAPIVVEMHTKSGLLERIRASEVSLGEADRGLEALLRAHFAAGSAVLAGNSIHTDRAFVRAYFPRAEALLHYRMVDVSSLKELVRRWYGEEMLYPKQNAHTAMADIRESLAELRHYRREVMRAPASLAAAARAPREPGT